MARLIYSCPKCGSQDVRMEAKFMLNPNRVTVNLSHDEYDWNSEVTACMECFENDITLDVRPEKP